MITWKTSFCDLSVGLTFSKAFKHKVLNTTMSFFRTKGTNYIDEEEKLYLQGLLDPIKTSFALRFSIQLEIFVLAEGSKHIFYRSDCIFSHKQ